MTAPTSVTSASTRVFVGPPDYGPDKRPFVSLVDDLLDRTEPDHEAGPPTGAADMGDPLLQRSAT